MSIELIFDGGSLGNPGRGYGSFITRGIVDQPDAITIHYEGTTTNNEAEYMTLIKGLEYVLAAMSNCGKNPASESIRVKSDSKLVVEQVNGRWKVRHPGLRPLHLKATTLLNRFGRWRVEWHPRAQSVRYLGH